MKGWQVVGILLALAVVLTLGLVACNDNPACAGPRPAPPRPAPPRPAPVAPKAPAYKPSAPKAPVSRPTVYKTRYENGHPVVYPVIVPVDDDYYEDCDD